MKDRKIDRKEGKERKEGAREGKRKEGERRKERRKEGKRKENNLLVISYYVASTVLFAQ